MHISRSTPLKALALATLSLAIAGCGLFTSSPPPAKQTHITRKKPSKPSAPKTIYPWRSHTLNPYLPGDLLIADSYNNRIIIVTPGKHIVWQFPPPGVTPNRRFDRPDDAFFGPHFNEIITNEEDYSTIAIIGIHSKQVVWEYGHHGVAGSAPGYLHMPDDAFLYDKNGQEQVTVADIMNQRLLFINRSTQQVTKQYGKTGVQVVNPPTTWGAPNGDFPAPNGGMLVTQINGNDVVLLNKSGQIVWTLHLPQSFPGLSWSPPFPYPSDANFTPHGNIIVAFYNKPGVVVKMTPAGKILWEYAVASGPGELNTPSLAVELPNGMIALNDDHNDRVIIIDPRTNKIVWQYGHTGVPGSAPGYLNVPDGIDFLPIGVTPGNPSNPIGGHLWSYPGNGY